VTLRNFRNVAIVAMAVFLAITIYSETRGHRTGDYGRLYSSELPARVDPKPVEVVTEATAVDEQTHADPMLVAPMARAQWLQGEETATVAVAAAPTVVSTAEAKGDVTIVGGPEGVSVVRAERRRPLLTGGFGR